MAAHGLQAQDIDSLGESMLEEIRRTATLRLRQIEPLIEEADRLREVLRALDGRPQAGAELARTPGRRLQAATSVSNASGGGVSGRAAKGANKRIILDLVAKHPGITAAEISERTGVKRTVVASTVSRLKRYGELRDHSDGGVCLAKPRIVG
jgi:predicted transcriptional regulator